MTASISLAKRPLPHVEIRHVPVAQSLLWLRRGWDDLRHIGWPSIAHGTLIFTMGAVLLSVGSAHLYLVVAAVTGYLLVGPIMTTGLCELARRRAKGESVGFDESLQAVTRNPSSLAQFGAVLGAIALVWLVASQVAVGSMVHARAPGLDIVLWGSFTAAIDRAQAGAYIGSGAILAATVFTLSVVSVPIIIDRGASATEAMGASARATWHNLPAMLVWSGLIVALTALGFLSIFGMVVVAPLLGHATWHAYRDLVR
ncbi:MAG TPA: DUF2189 domain-containing protein [Steroidobacteraceae bacterium]|nr:DUF2189 domain-containing protein [Steroidobacteraceae bacterium]